MRNRYITTLALLLALLLGACQSERGAGLELSAPKESILDESLFDDASGIEPDQVAIYLDEQLASEIIESSTGLTLRSSQSPLATTLRSAGTQKIERMFPHAGEYEERTKRAGLDRWYIVHFDSPKSVKETAKLFEGIDGVQLVEPLVILSQPYQAGPTYTESQLKGMLRASQSGFDDPLLYNQWHYENDGSYPFSSKDADIDLFGAWEIETGKPNVIVAVVDGGIDYTHPDLAQNMWRDAEGNYGYNFGTNSTTITPESHGTHVAGTIAAVNNNGIGVAGVAGGNGNPDSGIRLMSCQIFGKVNGNGATAIKWGADHGAVISQNSWGLTSKNLVNVPKYLRDAIDYFITYAGCDNNGNQLPSSPMKGGIVIVAAGNDNADYPGYPQAYSRVISVAATAWDFTKASYSNYSNWITISAPGGDQNRYNYYGGGVFSTYPVDNGEPKYGYMQGTSMACPHVSGVAALIVSKFGGEGFTADDLVKRLSTSVKAYDINAQNPQHKGKLGYGHLSATAALSVPKSTPPLKVEFTEHQQYDRKIKLTWKVPADQGNGVPARYYVYASDRELNKDNYLQYGAPMGSDPTHKFVAGLGKKAGSEMELDFNNLEPENTLHFAIVAEDRFGLKSEPSFTTRSTSKLAPIVITGAPEQIITLNTAEKRELLLSVSTSVNSDWTFSIEGETKGVFYERKGNQLRLVIHPVLGIGQHIFTLIFKDEYGQSNTCDIAYEIKAYKQVEILPIPMLIVGLNEGAKTIDLSPYIVAETNNIRLETTILDRTYLKAHDAVGTTIKLEPIKAGITEVQLVANDGFRKSQKRRVNVVAVKNSLEDILYVTPLPLVGNSLRFIANPNVKEVKVIIQSREGYRILEQVFSNTTPDLHEVDLSNVASGNYTIYFVTGDKTTKHNLVKS